MGYVRATQGPNRYTMTTSPQRVADKNKARGSVTLEADLGNTTNIFFGYDNPGVTNAGTGQGSALKPGAIAVEAPPAVFTGEIWAIGAAGGEVLVVFETTDEDVAAGL